MLRAPTAVLIISVALTAAGVCPAVAATSQDAQVHITVIDANNNPVAWATIELTTALGSIRATSLTLECDLGGECDGGGIPPGLYYLTVHTLAAVKSLKAPISVVAAKPNRVIVRIENIGAATLVSLGTVRITATGALSTSSAPSAEINAQALAERGEQDLINALARQPGVTLSLPNGSITGLPKSIILRGSDPKETIIELDGHPINNSNSGDFDVSLLDSSAFSNIQIVYGLAPSSLVGANTEGGTVNLHTLEPTAQPHGLLRYSLGSVAANGLTIATTGSTGLLGYAFELHNFNKQGDVNNFPVIDAATGLSATLNSNQNASNALAKLKYTIPGDGALEVSVLTFGSRSDLSAALSSPTDPTNANPNATFTSFAGSQRNNVSLFYNADVRLPIGRNSDDRTPPAFVTARHMTSVTRQGVSGSAAGINEYLLSSSDAIEDDDLQYERLLPNADLTFVARIRAERLRLPDDFGVITPTQAQTERSILARYMWNGGARLEYTATAYASWYSTFGTSLDPRVAVVWTPSTRTVIRASIGTGFQAPSLTARFVPSPLPLPNANGLITVGNPNLKADHTTEYELGADHLLGNGPGAARVELDLYRVNQRGDDIQFIPAGASPLTPMLSYPVNLANSVWRGAALHVDQPLGHGMTARCSYNLNQVYPLSLPPEVQNNNGNIVPFAQFESVPLHRATLSFEHSQNNLAWMIVTAYIGKNNELNRPPFATVDANIKYTLGHTDAALAANNLTNVYNDRFALVGAGVPYPGLSGPISTNAYPLQARSLTLTLTQHW